MFKKRKISGLDGTKLEKTLDSSKKYRQSTDVAEEGEDAGEASTKTLDKLIARMESRRTGPQALGSDYETLNRLNIVASGDLRLKPDHKELTQESKLVGKDGPWSSAQMYSHLEFLEKLIPTENEASARMYIATFLFRASATVPPGYRMVFNTEPPSLATVSGFVDYRVVVAEDEAAGQSDIYFDAPQVGTARRLNTGFFVTEAKSSPIYRDIPQAVCKLYRSGKRLQRDRVRGALTNGHEWIFIILYFGAGGKGASYKYSGTIRYCVMGDGKPEEPYPDIIAGILSYWTRKSSDDIDGDDWFEVFKRCRDS